MNKFLQDLLVDPISKEPLQLKDGKLFSSSQQHFYDIIEQVPILLPKKPLAISSRGAIHQSTKTKFDYQDHYQKDAEYFNYFKPFEDGATIHENQRLHQMILGRVPDEATLVLDIGCGNGWVADHFADRKKFVISMDISTKNPIQVQQKQNHDRHSGLVGDVFNLPIKPKSVDCIIAAEIMEHVPDPQQFIAALFNILKPGGRLIITTPYNEQIEYNLCVHCNQPTPRHAHLHSFSEKNIGKFLPAEVNHVTLKKFSNKALIKLRSHFVLKYVSFNMWKMVDNLTNAILPKQTRFLIEINQSPN